MPTMMEQVTGQLSKPLDISGIAKGSADALHAGMALAQRKQELELKRQELETQKKYAQVQTGYFVMGKLKEIALEKDPAMKKIMIEGLDSQMREMGLGGVPKGTQVWMKTPSYGEMYMKAYRVFRFMQEHKPEEAEKIIMGLPEHVQQPTLQLVDSFRAAAGAQAKIDQFKSQQAQREERLSQGQQRLEKTKDDQAKGISTMFNNDKVLVDYGRRIDSSERLNHTFNSATIITPQLLNEGTTELGTMLTGLNQLPVSREEGQKFQSVAIRMAELKQKYGNKPVDLRKVAPEFLDQLLDTSKRLGEIYRLARKNRANDMLQRLPDFANNPAAQQVKEKIRQQFVDSDEGKSGKSVEMVNTQRRKAQLAIEKINEQFKDDPAGRDKALQFARAKFKEKTGLDLDDNKTPVQQQPAGKAIEKPVEVEAAGDEQSQAATQMGEQQPPEEQPTSEMQIEPVQDGEENADAT